MKNIIVDIAEYNKNKNLTIINGDDDDDTHLNSLNFQTFTRGVLFYKG